MTALLWNALLTLAIAGLAGLALGASLTAESRAEFSVVRATKARRLRSRAAE